MSAVHERTRNLYEIRWYPDDVSDSTTSSGRRLRSKRRAERLAAEVSKRTGLETFLVRYAVRSKR